MCDVCMKTICPCTCPNAESPKPVCKCDACGGKLYVGDPVTIIKNFVFCEDCIWSCSQKLDFED